MGNKGTGGSGQDKTVGILRVIVWILTALLVAVVMELSYWWASEEKIIADRKISKLKRELEICRREQDNE
jgi:hypothetical protein